MVWQAYLLASFFAAIALVCVALIPFGFPGMWMMLGMAFLLEFGDALVVPASAGGATITFGWTLLAVCGGLGLIGEGIEATGGALGTRYGGGTARGMWGAILGGIVGAIVFTMGVPIPLVGTLLGAVVGTFAGAFVGEATGEESRHRPRSENLRAAFAATVGRLAGTLGKTVIAIVIWVMLVWRAFGL